VRQGIAAFESWFFQKGKYQSGNPLPHSKNRAPAMKTPANHPTDPVLPSGFTLRHDLQPGDLGRLIAFHGKVYAQEYGLNNAFEAYVAATLGEFVLNWTERHRLWIAEQGQSLAGCIGIVGRSAAEAQLRWFLVDPSARGKGLGKFLLHQAVAFCRHRGCDSIFLWTVNLLEAAARQYCSVGFTKVEEKPGQPWGVAVIEEKYVLHLRPAGSPGGDSG
jgi:GNAT superfamily N-acetyltransferase